MIPNEQPIAITGASTGIGKATALYLDRLGFRVFAGIRKEADGQALSKEASDRLTPIHLDVTDDNSIADTISIVTEATSGELFGLINNAGLSLNGPLELVPGSEMKKLMDVKPIKTDANYREGLNEIETLMMAELDSPEGEKLDALVTLVEAYERKHYPLDLPDPVEAIKFAKWNRKA